METAVLLDAHVQLKRIYNLFTEILDLSRQLAEAVDRNDGVSMRLLISMRQEPIEKLGVARQSLEQQQASLSPEDSQHLADLLKGAPAMDSTEKPLAEQVASNSRLLQQVVALDKTISLKLARENSFYSQSR